MLALASSSRCGDTIMLYETEDGDSGGVEFCAGCADRSIVLGDSERITTNKTLAFYVTFPTKQNILSSADE